jgi:hypothetical protein
VSANDAYKTCQVCRCDHMAGDHDDWSSGPCEISGCSCQQFDPVAIVLTLEERATLADLLRSDDPLYLRRLDGFLDEFTGEDADRRTKAMLLLAKLGALDEVLSREADDEKEDA